MPLSRPSRGAKWTGATEDHVASFGTAGAPSARTIDARPLSALHAIRLAPCCCVRRDSCAHANDSQRDGLDTLLRATTRLGAAPPARRAGRRASYRSGRGGGVDGARALHWLDAAARDGGALDARLLGLPADCALHRAQEAAADAAAPGRRAHLPFAHHVPRPDGLPADHVARARAPAQPARHVPRAGAPLQRPAARPRRAQPRARRRLPGGGGDWHGAAAGGGAPAAVPVDGAARPLLPRISAVSHPHLGCISAQVPLALFSYGQQAARTASRGIGLGGSSFAAILLLRWLSCSARVSTTCLFLGADPAVLANHVVGLVYTQCCMFEHAPHACMRMCTLSCVWHGMYTRRWAARCCSGRWSGTAAPTRPRGSPRARRSTLSSHPHPTLTLTLTRTRTPNPHPHP